MKQRIQLDITRWRNLAGQLEEFAAWIATRNPNLGALNSINLDYEVVFYKSSLKFKVYEKLHI